MTLRPYPFGALVRRAFVERDREGSIFGLSSRRWFTGFPTLDLSVDLHGSRVATPFGPAAGPHTQLAQNIVLSWLAGARAIELKTVQVQDRLNIPRPCIDMRTTGFNVEWSQELTLAESLEEYVKASMLLQILSAGGVLPETAGGRQYVFDVSVGYDLAGLTSERMTRFFETMLDARAIIERLRADIPSEWAAYRDLEFDATISRSVTLSTFHGCPPTEIEAIVRYLQRAFAFHCTVKFNPTLLGRSRVREALSEQGYGDLRVPDSVFASDLQWGQAADLVGRCGESAAALGLGFGMKCSNTLVVENTGDFLPATEGHRYLSGRPLHLLATQMVGDFRRAFGTRYPISFSAGVERWNFADVVALGLKPVTVCTDMLREAGYGRVAAYFTALAVRMQEARAGSVDELVERHAARTDGDLARATDAYVATLPSQAKLKASGVRPPRKVGSNLALFDCLACDKCLPVCPNHALFTYTVPPGAIHAGVASLRNGRWSLAAQDIPVERRHQIGVFADFCNECGNCDIFCPEHGGPYRTKPRFFGSLDGWAQSAADGFWVGRRHPHLVARARLNGKEYGLEERGALVYVAVDDFEASFDPSDPAGTWNVQPVSPVADIDLAPFALMHAIGRAVLDEAHINYINVLAARTDEPAGPQTPFFERSMTTPHADITKLARDYTPDIVRFLRDLIAIPSESAGEREVVERIANEMTDAGFDEVKVDGLGNVLGRVGSGPRVIAIDGHVDTVGVGDPTTWQCDPYEGDLRDGIIYGRGASDQKAGIASAVHAGRILKKLGIDDQCQLWVTGTVMEEDCDGLCWQYILREGVLRPEVVVITEPTSLGVYRGHRGRMEMEVRVQGRSCHGSAPERGINAVYRMGPIVADIERLNDALGNSADAFLGKGSVTIAEIRSTSPSLCAVADSCTIHLDRRLTRGETLERAVEQILALESVRKAGATVHVLEYARPSYTGLTYPTKKYYPTWTVAEDHPAVSAAVSAARGAIGREPVVGKWVFSTNAVATCGMFGIPSVGFGPANEVHAHAPDDQCPVEHLTAAAIFYARFPECYVQRAAAV